MIVTWCEVGWIWGCVWHSKRNLLRCYTWCIRPGDIMLRKTHTDMGRSRRFDLITYFKRLSGRSVTSYFTFDFWVVLPWACNVPGLGLYSPEEAELYKTSLVSSRKNAATPCWLALSQTVSNVLTIHPQWLYVVENHLFQLQNVGEDFNKLSENVLSDQGWAVIKDVVRQAMT